MAASSVLLLLIDTADWRIVWLSTELESVVIVAETLHSQTIDLHISGGDKNFLILSGALLDFIVEAERNSKIWHFNFTKTILSAQTGLAGLQTYVATSRIPEG